jgi:hypothetical protein
VIIADTLAVVAAGMQEQEMKALAAHQLLDAGAATPQ